MIKITKAMLQSLRLTEAQGKVYLAALELGHSSIQGLAKKSGVKRTSIHNFIEELQEKRFLTATRKKKRVVYSAVHPEYLVEVERSRLVELQKTLPELLAVYNQSKTKPRVTFYEGLEGIKEVYADTLREKKPIVAWSDFSLMEEALGSDYMETYPAQRARQNITFKTILKDTPAARRLMAQDIRYLRECKLIQGKNIKTEINIYGRKVALMSFRSSPPFVVLIEDTDISDTLREIWEHLWERIR